LSILSHTANIEKIIVIGDDQQLSPIYDWQYYNYFKDNGFEKEFRFFFVLSFFNFIYNKNKSKSIFLTNNYRSEPKIVNFINNFYENKLKAKKEQSTLSFEIIRSKSYEKSKNKFQFLMNNKNLTIRNTIFMCEYKKVIKDLHLFLDKKIFNTTTSIQGNEADNICIFLTRNIGTNDCNSQLDYRTVNVAFSRARKRVYIFSYDGIVDMHLIDKSNK
jgi:ATP-dependent exoDNAse (exonuclease V) alpha subunit